MNNSKAVFENYEVANVTPVEVKGKCFRVDFILMCEGFTHVVEVYDEKAKELRELFKSNTYPPLTCSILAWAQGIRHPDTNRLILDKKGKQVLIQKVMFCVEKFES